VVGGYVQTGPEPQHWLEVVLSASRYAWGAVAEVAKGYLDVMTLAKATSQPSPNLVRICYIKEKLKMLTQRF
jgi:hypothetical protein